MDILCLFFGFCFIGLTVTTGLTIRDIGKYLEEVSKNLEEINKKLDK